jgi:hypothetical protein
MSFVASDLEDDRVPGSIIALEVEEASGVACIDEPALEPFPARTLASHFGGFRTHHSTAAVLTRHTRTADNSYRPDSQLWQGGAVSDEEREERSDESAEEEPMSADSGGDEEDEKNPEKDPLSGY